MFDLRCFSCLFWVFGFCSFAGRFGKFALHLDVFPLIHLIFSKNNKPTPSISMFDLCCCCFFFFVLFWSFDFVASQGDFGSLFPPCFGLVFLLWNSSVSLSSMKLEYETLDFQLQLDSNSLDFKEQN